VDNPAWISTAFCALMNGGESVEIVETFLLSSKLFEIKLRSRGSEYGVETKWGGGQSISKYLFKLPLNNLGGMTKNLKSTRLLEFLSKNIMQKYTSRVSPELSELQLTPEIHIFIPNRLLVILGLCRWLVKNRLPTLTGASTRPS